MGCGRSSLQDYEDNKELTRIIESLTDKTAYKVNKLLSIRDTIIRIKRDDSIPHRIYSMVMRIERDLREILEEENK